MVNRGIVLLAVVLVVFILVIVYLPEPIVTGQTKLNTKNFPSGVTLYDEDRAYIGLNLYTSRPRTDAHLIDMEGNVIHTWSVDSPNAWLHVEIDDKKNLFVTGNGGLLMKLDWNSNTIWRTNHSLPPNISVFHHDIAIAKNKDIYSLTKDKINISHRLKPLPVINEYIVILSPEGTPKKVLSFLDLLKDYMTADILDEIIAENLTSRSFPDYYDIFHSNALEIIDRDLEGIAKEGDVLISLRSIDLIGIFDIEKEELIWSWGSGQLDGQHDPKILQNGNILIFDNGRRRNYSRIVELNPITKEIVWEYRNENFYSSSRGGSQELPNGNILITDSNSGKVFEITREGEIVWEFYNPDLTNRTKPNGVNLTIKSPIYRMHRFNPDHFKNILEQ